jgi:hypothetical protein
MGKERGRRGFGQEVKVEEMRHWVQAGDGCSFGGTRRGGGGRGVPETARLLILRAWMAASSGRADSARVVPCARAGDQQPQDGHWPRIALVVG